MHCIQNSRPQDSDHFPGVLLFLFSSNSFKTFFSQPNCPPASSLAKISEKLSRSSLSYKISFHLLLSYYLVSYFIKYLLRSIIPLQPFLVILTYFQGGGWGRGQVSNLICRPHLLLFAGLFSVF